MYAKLKQFLLGIPYFNQIAILTFLLPFILPGILEPEWAWRISTFFLACVGLFFFTLRVLLVPELLKNDIKNGGEKTKKLLFFLGYIIIPILVVGSIFFAYELSVDVLNIGNLKTEKVLIEDASGGGVTLFAVQSLVFNGQTHSLFFNWSIIKPHREYLVTYSPKTRFIYEIHLTDAQQ